MGKYTGINFLCLPCGIEKATEIQIAKDLGGKFFRFNSLSIECCKIRAKFVGFSGYKPNNIEE